MTRRFVTNLICTFLQRNKLYLAAYILFMFAYPISSVFLPKYYGQIVENLKNNQPVSFRTTFILLVLTNVMFLTLDMLDTTFIPRLQAFVRTEIVKKVLSHYRNNYQEQQLGVLISKIVKLPIVIRDLVHQVRNYIVPILFILVMIVVRFTTIDKRIGGICLAGLIVGGSVLYHIAKKCLNISTSMDFESDEVHENISELFDNILDVYSMNTENDELAALERRQEQVIHRYKSTFRCTNRLRGLMSGMSIGLFLSLIMYSYSLFRKGEIDLASMINIAITGMYIIGKIGSFSGETPDMIFNLGVYIRISDYLSEFSGEEGEEEREDITSSSSSAPPSIQFKNVTIKYSSSKSSGKEGEGKDGDKTVLSNFNLSLQPGERVAIIGKTGSGKSSLVKALLKLLPPSNVEGEITVGESSRYNRSDILYIRQNPLPFNRSVYDNVMYGNGSSSSLEGVTKEDVDKLLKKYNLQNFFERDLSEPVGRSGGRLSGGQRMVMFLLRTIIDKDKKIVILDEPTSSLDKNTTDIILKMIIDATEGKTTLIITHDDVVKNIVDRVVTIE